MNSLTNPSQNKSPNNPNYWLYATIGLVTAILLGFTFYFLRSTDTPAIRKLISSEMKVDGEVFIVTQGGQNFKLGLVQICAVSEEKINKWINNKRNRAKLESVNAQKTVDLARKKKLQADDELRVARKNEDRAQNVFMANPLAPGSMERTSSAREYSSQKLNNTLDRNTELKSAEMALQKI